ncbi:MAG: class I SAM-dependent methyltransferase [Thermomicrobiales bacterium]|nr:class I SAM-dependent methyltransferase [Thermomicrobiales bacterium]
MNTKADITSHYTSDDALERIDARLRAQGIDPEHPTLEAMAPFDNFHSRGLAGTLDLIALADFPAGARILDVGGGWGGPARVLASRTGVQVTVLDLTPSSVAIGRVLTERLGSSDRVSFEVGDGTAMPFPDRSFDGAWTEHSSMNIEHKHALYREIHRVLEPGARLAMHEIVAGNGEPVDYPMPWATSADTSFLLSAPEMRSLIATAGFRELAWQDETEKTLAEATAQQSSGPTYQPPGQMIVFGPAFVERIQNVGKDLRAGKLAVVQALFERI